MKTFTIDEIRQHIFEPINGMKNKARVTTEKLNAELADFKAKHEALEQKLSAEVDNQDQYRADYRELKNIESDIEATENMIRLSAINPDHLNQVAIESWNKGVKEFEFSILKLQEDYETTKQKLKKLFEALEAKGNEMKQIKMNLVQNVQPDSFQQLADFKAIDSGRDVENFFYDQDERIDRQMKRQAGLY